MLTPSGATTIGGSIGSMGELTLEQRKNLEKLFHIAYFIGYKGKSYTDFMDLLELENACRDFVTFCFKTIFHKKAKDKLECANFVSILCDGSTDSAVIEKESIYVLFVDPDTFSPTLLLFSL